MRRLGILLSGRGSNFVAIAEAIERGLLDAEIAVVLSDIADAPGLERARGLGLTGLAIAGKGAERDGEIVRQLQAHDVELVCLAGYMRKLSAVVVDAFQNRILNIHPSLLPAFPGLHAQEQALAHGVKVAGCTVHFVDAGIDSGPIVRQAAVPVLGDDTVASLSQRILDEEHRIYREAIALVLAGTYAIEGRRVIER
jgi:phosphoribosylglycinamide formyltransferase 1